MVKPVIFFLVSLALLTACNSSKQLNLFSIEDDIKFGVSVASQIESDTSGYTILDSASNVKVYQYIYDIRNELLNSGQVKYKSEFPWRIRIIQDDSTLNAFCTPGGYIYVFTGIMKFLDSGDQLAGILGHEMGHADLRHSTRQMTQMFGVQLLLEVLAGKQQAIKEVGGALIGLKFSRNHEVEADNNSVQYLCPTNYNAAGGAGFFEKIQSMGGGKVPEFLSTHPDPGNRIQGFNAKKEELNCKGTATYKNEYQEMLKLLP